MPPQTSVPLRKFPPGTSLPIRNVPSPVYSKEVETEPPPHYLEWAATRQLKLLGPISRWYGDQSRTVEEYAGESVESPTGETTLTVQPDYEPASEVITEVLITGPPQAAFTLQLGDRYMTLATDVTGMCLLTEVLFRLKPTSKRILTVSGTIGAPTGIGAMGTAAIVAATAGFTFIPNIPANQSVYITGFDISLSTVGTANMTVQVTGVAGGFLTYTLLTGQQSLSVRFPVPLPQSVIGTAPTLTWSATAAAVGQATLLGETSQNFPGSWLIHMSGYALARNET